ncbi:MAG: hypothetical protein LBD15_01690 [Holosporales bacterium]|nr:hypothetical protein [Holosporales bacterium]
MYPLIINEPDADCLAERVLLHFMDNRGAFKRTYTARFDAFDEEVEEFLEKHFLRSISPRNIL